MGRSLIVPAFVCSPSSHVFRECKSWTRSEMRQYPTPEPTEDSSDADGDVSSSDEEEVDAPEEELSTRTSLSLDSEFD